MSGTTRLKPPPSAVNFEKKIIKLGSNKPEAGDASNSVKQTERCRLAEKRSYDSSHLENGIQESATVCFFVFLKTFLSRILFFVSLDFCARSNMLGCFDKKTFPGCCCQHEFFMHVLQFFIIFGIQVLSHAK